MTNFKCQNESQLIVNWEICGNYFYTSWWKGETCQGFPNSIKRVGKKSPVPEGRVGIFFGEGRDFLIGWWKSVEEWLLLFKPISMLKAKFCKYWTSTKPKLGWPVCTSSMKLKWKLYRSNDCSWKSSFYRIITWKLLFSLGDKNLMGSSFPCGGELTNFQLLGLLPTTPSWRKIMHATIFLVS